MTRAISTIIILLMGVMLGSAAMGRLELQRFAFPKRIHSIQQHDPGIAV